MRRTFKRCLLGIGIVILTTSLPNIANADIAKYYAESNGKVYEYSLTDLLNSLNGNGKVFTSLMDRQVVSVYDDESNAYIDFYKLIDAVNSGKDVLKFAAEYTGESVEMPETVTSVTEDENGKIKEEERLLEEKIEEEFRVINIY